MKRQKTFIMVLLLLVQTLFLSAQESREEMLDRKIDEYAKAIETEPAKIQCEEADFLISTVTDSLLRQRVALRLYDRFSGSRIMGAEAVAIHIYDRWFADGSIRMRSESELWTAKLFAETNRRSLIGCRAQEMALEDTSGTVIRLFGRQSGTLMKEGTPADTAMIPGQAPAWDKGWRILYFYDTDCAVCRIESAKLRNLLAGGNFGAEVYAVYTGTDRRAWKDYISERLPSEGIRHFWDPELRADIAYNYGVLSTPKIFLISPQGIIDGRNLDTDALKTLLEMRTKPLEYGSSESADLFDRIFASAAPLDCNSVSETASSIAAATSGEERMYRQLVGDLLYYITNRREEAFKCGTERFIEDFILSRNDIWTSSDDSLKVVGLASMMKELAALSPIGSRLPEARVHASVITARGEKEGIYRLDKVRGRSGTIVFFHTEGCPVCKAEEAAAKELVKSDRSIKVISINMDLLYSSYPSEADIMFRNFDLSSLPLVIFLDSEGRVSRKYITLQSF